MRGFNPKKQWKWSGMPLTIIDFCPFSVMIPEMYLCSSDFQNWKLDFFSPLPQKPPGYNFLNMFPPSDFNLFVNIDRN